MTYQNIQEEQLIEIVTQAVLKELQKKTDDIPVGISVRHIHLTRSDVDWLFGRNYQLTPKKALSQPGQYACEECLDVIGPKGELKKVRILGPERSSAQVELSQTDLRTIGLTAPVRSSGDLDGTPGVRLRGPNGEITLSKGVIIADRHIHMTPEDALRFGVKDGDIVSVEVGGIKPGIMGNVLIRVSETSALDMHIDTDDGNAFMLSQGQRLRILKQTNR